MIIVYHIKNIITGEERYSLTTDFDKNHVTLVREAFFNDAKYEPVAAVNTDDLEYAYAATNNGVISQSWSREPPEGVIPVFPGFHIIRGEIYGRKSSEVGDVFDLNGVRYVVASCGFTPLE
jgi:hypothetical protein